MHIFKINKLHCISNEQLWLKEFVIRLKKTLLLLIFFSHDNEFMLSHQNTFRISKFEVRDRFKTMQRLILFIDRPDTWCSAKVLACHAAGPGSIPGRGNKDALISHKSITWSLGLDRAPSFGAGLRSSVSDPS